MSGSRIQEIETVDGGMDRPWDYQIQASDEDKRKAEKLSSGRKFDAGFERLFKYKGL